ncbi:Trm112 family protein [Actinomycetospora sp. OC33-EN08]|uniref:UPF0434 protein WCD74_25720 n=1 Tax=Actinomycetospora aurantiaca TaxID=3129233 RepID=A0ABU8MV40_9PSEU
MSAQPAGLDPALLEILACPAPDHGELRPDADASTLTCAACGRTYPVTDGIPVLLLSEATGGPSAPGPDAGSGETAGG